eukprot:7646454-Alexandrium_andersonii.AAC.1
MCIIEKNTVLITPLESAEVGNPSVVDLGSACSRAPWEISSALREFSEAPTEFSELPRVIPELF